jgi:hypothetical protein
MDPGITSRGDGVWGWGDGKGSNVYRTFLVRIKNYCGQSAFFPHRLFQIGMAGPDPAILFGSPGVGKRIAGSGPAMTVVG